MDNIKRDTYIDPEEDRLQESKDELDKLETRVKDLEETNEELSLQASILDKATDAIFLRDMNRIIIFANDTACKTYGYSKEEFTGMNVNTLIPGGEMPDFEERLKTIMDNGELTAEVTHLRKDKSLIPVEVHTHRILMGKENISFLLPGILPGVRLFVKRWVHRKKNIAFWWKMPMRAFS